LLARRRTALLVPWLSSNADAKPVALRAAAGAQQIVALAEPGTIANVRECNGRWCRVIIEPYEGWVEQTSLWGVYDKERIKP
jgi:SH3-like domain-containing protein